MNVWDKKKLNKMIKVYIASPYTLGDVAKNVKLQLDTVDLLMNSGFVPFTPLYSHFQHMSHPRPYEDWLTIDFEWIKSCDCLLRLDGESNGADKEVEYATKLGIPVFYSIDDLYLKYNKEIVNHNIKPYKKYKKLTKKVGWFLFSLFISVSLISIFHDYPSFCALLLFIIGYFRLTELE